MQNKNLTIYGNGKQTRSFCYVDDMIDGLIKLMNSSNNFTGPVNLGNPEEINILTLAKKIIHIINSESKIIYFDLPEDDPVKRKPDIKKALNNLDWKPQEKIDSGLKKTITFSKKNLIKGNKK